MKEDFDVLDNGKPVTLTLFQNEPEPFSVVVMLDTSGSMTRRSICCRKRPSSS